MAIGDEIKMLEVEVEEVETVSLEGFRFYKIGNEYYPSVTSILSVRNNPALEKWKKRYSETEIKAILDYTSIRGEIIHFMALQEYETEFAYQEASPDEEIDIANQNPQMLKEISKALELFSEFQDRYTLKVKYLEKAVFNEEFRYAGRVDFCGFLIDSETGFKKPILMDIKTSKQIYQESASLQLSAYNFCLDNFAERLYVLLLHPGSTTVDGITIGALEPYWRFEEVKNSFLDFTYYQALFKPKAQRILAAHGLL